MENINQSSGSSLESICASSLKTGRGKKGLASVAKNLPSKAQSFFATAFMFLIEVTIEIAFGFLEV